MFGVCLDFRFVPLKLKYEEHHGGNNRRCSYCFVTRVGLTVIDKIGTALYHEGGGTPL